MDLEQATAVVYGEEEVGFDPTEIVETIEAAGFGAGRISLEARGTLSSWEGLPALALPGSPSLLILGGGAESESLSHSDLPVGTGLRVEGEMHPSHADKPAGMTVEAWELLRPDG